MRTKANVIHLRVPQSRHSRATRPFLALHIFAGRVVRRTFASSLESAVKFSVEHLWRDSYGAWKVQVLDRRTEGVVAVLAKNRNTITAWRLK